MNCCAATRSRIAYADSAVDTSPGAWCPARRIQPAGFAPDEALLPWSARGFSGFRLLTEYFAFPDKFLFLDFTRIDTKTMISGGNKLEIFVYLDRAAPELERSIGQPCPGAGLHAAGQPVPAALRADPADPHRHRIPRGARRQAPARRRGLERRAGARNPAGRLLPALAPVLPPERGRGRARSPGQARGPIRAGRRHARRLLPRRPPPRRAGRSRHRSLRRPQRPGFDPDKPADTVLSVDALCLSRDLPTDLPFGGGHPTLRLVEGAAAVAAIRAVTPPSITLRPPLRERGFWRLVSHLSLGHLAVTGGADGANALKEVLRLYDLKETAETHSAIEAITGDLRPARHRTRSRPTRRFLPRPRRDAGIRPAHLAGQRAVFAGLRAGALPGPARHHQQLHPYHRHAPRPPRHRRRLARP